MWWNLEYDVMSCYGTEHDLIWCPKCTPCACEAGKLQMGVSENRGTPKWMVKILENPIKMDDLGVPLFSETSKYTILCFLHTRAHHHSTMTGTSGFLAQLRLWKRIFPKRHATPQRSLTPCCRTHTEPGESLCKICVCHRPQIFFVVFFWLKMVCFSVV